MSLPHRLAHLLGIVLHEGEHLVHGVPLDDRTDAPPVVLAEHDVRGVRVPQKVVQVSEGLLIRPCEERRPRSRGTGLPAPGLRLGPGRMQLQGASSAPPSPGKRSTRPSESHVMSASTARRVGSSSSLWIGMTGKELVDAPGVEQRLEDAEVQEVQVRELVRVSPSSPSGSSSSPCVSRERPGPGPRRSPHTRPSTRGRCIRG